MKILDEEILQHVIIPRPRESHKGDYGRVLIIGGNAQYGGAAILAASAAVYAGSGLVTVATDTVNRTALHARLPEAMVLDWQQSLPFESYDVVVIGSGLGLENAALLREVVMHQRQGQWLVIDGSAITLFAQAPQTLVDPSHVVFTPHQMELQRLSGLTIPEQTAEALQTFTEKLGVLLVAKSHTTTIYQPGKEAYHLQIGTPAQATGGMGDTLAGLIGSFLGQFKTASAVLAATYLHSQIAHELSADQYVVLPSRLIEKIPQAMQNVLKLRYDKAREN